MSTSPEPIRVRRAGPDEATAAGLAEVLIDCVAGGASVSFMAPLARDRATAFWREVLADTTTSGRIVLVADEPATGAIVGTVQVVLTMPDNQPHRGEVAKMLVHRSARRRGVADALMRAAEAAALDAGKTLLVLDTASADAERVYERLGWARVGTIPDYALGPTGDLLATTIFYKTLTRPRDPNV